MRGERRDEVRRGEAMGGDGRGFGPKTRRDEAWGPRSVAARNLPGTIREKLSWGLLGSPGAT